MVRWNYFCDVIDEWDVVIISPICGPCDYEVGFREMSEARYPFVCGCWRVECDLALPAFEEFWKACNKCKKYDGWCYDLSIVYEVAKDERECTNNDNYAKYCEVFINCDGSYLVRRDEVGGV